MVRLWVSRHCSPSFQDFVLIFCGGCRDDDTWWTDQASIRELVAGFDWREDHILGGFSEAEGNYQDHGRIAYGGAGASILSHTRL